MKGRIIHNYILNRLLGEGGMGYVYHARHLRTNREVAVKVLRQELFSSQQVRSMFRNEANALIRLVHPNIVRILDYVEQENIACLVMEYIDGFTVDEYINKVSGPIHAQKAVNLMWQVLDGVEFAHRSGIFHRDIKPGNIMLNKEGTAARIMDFGISRLSGDLDTKHTREGTSGTPFYMCPEQVLGEPYTAKGDIYSLGVTLFEMITGRCPYTDILSLNELHTKIINEPLPPTEKYYSGVPGYIQTAINMATCKMPSQRFKTCNEFRDYLLGQKNKATT